MVCFKEPLFKLRDTTDEESPGVHTVLTEPFRDSGSGVSKEPFEVPCETVSLLILNKLFTQDDGQGVSSISHALVWL